MRDLDRWKDKVEISLDGRQIFFLFFGSAIAACLIFVTGVLIGKRIEARALALQPAPIEDPLAALDQLGDADEADEGLTFHKALAPARAAKEPKEAKEQQKEPKDKDDKSKAVAAAAVLIEDKADAPLKTEKLDNKAEGKPENSRRASPRSRRPRRTSSCRGALAQPQSSPQLGAAQGAAAAAVASAGGAGDPGEEAGDDRARARSPTPPRRTSRCSSRPSPSRRRRGVHEQDSVGRLQAVPGRQRDPGQGRLLPRPRG